MLKVQKIFLRIRLEEQALSEDNVRSENVVLRKKSQLMACPFRFNGL